jgi:hypothetical protein
VFGCSLLLTLADLAYIAVVLPESRPPSVRLDAHLRSAWRSGGSRSSAGGGGRSSGGGGKDDGSSDLEPLIPAAYSPLDALEIFSGDPLLSQVARVTFLYYTAVWAVVSTLMVSDTLLLALLVQTLVCPQSALGHLGILS